MSAQESLRIAHEHYDAFNTREFDRGAQLVAPDAEIVNVPAGLTLRGPEGYKQFLSTWCTAFPDAKVVTDAELAGENGVVSEFRGTGTMNGPLPGPAGLIPPTGGKLNLPFCEVIRIQDGKIASLHLYYDAATMARQIGLVPATA